MEEDEREALRREPSTAAMFPHQFVDTTDDALRGFAQLLDAPVGGVALGNFAGPGVVGQPLRE